MQNEKKTITPLSELGEFGLIKRLTKPFECKNSSTIKGVGDDCAIITSEGKQLVVTTDLLVEGIHFDLVYTPLAHLGYKSVAVNLSDVCAMGAIPTQITVSIAASAKFSVESLEQLYDGIRRACSRYDVDLVGGDTTSSMTGLVICITAIGQIPEGKASMRSGAKVGDLICVSGDLGGAYAGFQVLQREKEVFMVNSNSQPDLKKYDYVVDRQLKPEPRLDVVRKLMELGIQPHSMIDVSDGLSSEILHICDQSNCGAKIFESKIPIDAQTEMVAEELNLDAIIFAMNGGEDYELLFTIDAADQSKIAQMLDYVTIIGYITEASEGCKLMGKASGCIDIVAQGWNAYKAD